jgi:AraC-like DNA-binding protein
MSITELNFSTRNVADADPIETMTDYVGRTLMRLDITLPGQATNLDYRYTLFGAEAALWGRGSTTPIRYERTANLLTDGNDDIAVAVLDTAIRVSTPEAGEFVVPRGDILVISQARRFTYELPRSTSGWTLQFKHKALKNVIPDLGEAPLRPVSSKTPGMMLLKSYLQASSTESLHREGAVDMMGQHLLDLAALTLSGADFELPPATLGGISRVRYELIEADMLTHLGSPQLDLEWIAARQRLSTRQVQRLFALRGTSFSDELRRLRLEKAAQMLANPALARHSVLFVAMEVGFNDAPAFNRAFKRHFGFTPGDLRRATRSP